MIDETNIQEELRWWYHRLARKTVSHFQRRNINAKFVAGRKEAVKRIMELIPEGVTVGWGDSVTLHQVGIISKLKKENRNKIYDPFERDMEGSLILKGKRRLNLMKKAMIADVFLSSVNAITADGRMVSTDATGNRVASLIFGPKRVIIVAGVNKIEKDLERALRRVKEFAAPINVKRHLVKHNHQRLADLPCSKKGTCVDCYDPERICNYTVIIEGEREPANVTGYIPRIHVIIIGEKLGI